MPVFAVRRERVLERRAAARAERHAVNVARLDRRPGGGKYALASFGFASPTASRATVRATLMYCSRKAGDTLSAAAMFVKPSTSISFGKYSVGVDFDAQKILHGARVLGPVQPLDWHMARRTLRRVRVDRAF